MLGLDSSSASHPVDGDGWEGVWLGTVGGHIARVVAGVAVVPCVPRVGVARPRAGGAGAREHSEIGNMVILVIVIVKFVFIFHLLLCVLGP